MLASAERYLGCGMTAPFKIILIISELRHYRSNCVFIERIQINGYLKTLVQQLQITVITLNRRYGVKIQQLNQTLERTLQLRAVVSVTSHPVAKLVSIIQPRRGLHSADICKIYVLFTKHRRLLPGYQARELKNPCNLSNREREREGGETNKEAEKKMKTHKHNVCVPFGTAVSPEESQTGSNGTDQLSHC